MRKPKGIYRVPFLNCQIDKGMCVEPTELICIPFYLKPRNTEKNSVPSPMDSDKRIMEGTMER